MENCVYLRPHIATKKYMNFIVNTLPKSYLYKKKKRFFLPVQYDKIRVEYVDKVLMYIRRWHQCF